MVEQEELHFKNRDQWRKWLELNHIKSDGVWVIYYKKHTGQKSLTYNEGVEEALCFGWIDSIVKTIDAQRYKQKYTPRRKNSIWSETNKKRIEKMLKEGKMTDAGLKKVDEAKKNGQWEKAYGLNVKTEMPEDLKTALQNNEIAFANFNNFAPGHQKTYIYWLNSAKRSETRKKRIDKIVSFSKQNIKPGIF